MNVHSISPAAQIGAASAPEPPGKSAEAPAKAAEAARQFEGILLRQFLSESMKPLLQGGSGGQVYGYLLTESLASSLVKGGGLGLSSILQAQLTQEPAQ